MNKRLRLNEEHKKEIPHFGLFLTSSNTFISCLGVIGVDQLNQLIEVGKQMGIKKSLMDSHDGLTQLTEAIPFELRWGNYNNSSHDGLSQLAKTIDCPFSPDTFKKEVETFKVMISRMPKANISNAEKELLKELKELMNMDPKSYKDFADLYYAISKRWPIEDPRYVDPKNDGSQKKLKKGKK